MDILRGTYRDGDDDEEEEPNFNTTTPTTTNGNILHQIQSITTVTTTTTTTSAAALMEDVRDSYEEEAKIDIISNGLHHPTQTFTTHIENTTTTTTATDVVEVFDGMSEGDATEEEEDEEEEEDDDDEEVVELESQQPQQQLKSPKRISASDEEEDEKPPNKKQKSISSFGRPIRKLFPGGPAGVIGMAAMAATTPTALKKPKKKNNNVWTKSTSRKGKKKGKLITNNVVAKEDTVLITPVARFPDRSDDSADIKICLSKVYKAEKVELSEDRLTAGSCKGYRMVRATRGVVEGAWYFEIKVLELGESGHTRLGWSTEKGDLQAPVGYDGNSFGYRDIDGSKVHKASRDKYGDAGYVEGDVVGFYINLPDGAQYAPKPPHFVWYKGQKYMCATDGKEESLKVIPGSEISFFKNGVCQGIAFKDLYGGRYYPAASMYTLPNQPNCVVKFNFGPEFEFFPKDLGDRPLPRPMIDVPYLPFDGGIENGVSDEKKS